MATNESNSSDSGNSDASVRKNRLADEKSPYLLQHATNPVDWYPWGDEAFSKALNEDKPIFLSVGYSTCHWCHVMERESFENEEIAKIMNENFVSIKVDREERPDVDKVYMTFVQATTGSGGWPMSVWLTPDLKPILGGTYFPPNDRYYGRPGFSTILKLISKQWKENKEKVLDQGTRIVDILMQSTALRPPEEAGAVLPGKSLIGNCFTELSHRYDEEYGGFGNAPKFPQPVNLNFLFYLYAKNPLAIEGKRALEMCVHTLLMMAKGGIHDHVAKGFHRYSTDQYWHVPHFEKMLYDQGQLVVAYLTAYQITKDERFADVARDILEYVARDMTDQHDGFYSAEDADSLPSHDSSHKREGAFCVWTEEEIRSLLTAPVPDKDNLTAADIMCLHFDIKPDGNVDPYQDPHEELKNKNVLIIRGDEEKTAEHFGITVELLRDIIAQSLKILFEARLERPKPHLDDKIVTSWNGLMISGFAKGAQVLDDSQYEEKASRAARFLYQYAYDENTKRLKRSVYKGPDGSIVNTTSPIPGVLEDYVFLIRGLLDLYEACYDPWCLEWANELQEVQDRLFLDREYGGYFNSVPDDPTIILRLKEDQDGAEPSPNSVAVSNLIRLSSFLDQPELQDRAARLVTTFSSRLEQIPHALPQMICGIMHLGASQQVVIVGEKDDADAKALLRQVHSHFLPFKVAVLADGNRESIVYKKSSSLKKLEQHDGKATAYVCQNQSCSLPVTNVEDLERLLLEPHEVFQF